MRKILSFLCMAIWMIPVGSILAASAAIETVQSSCPITLPGDVNNSGAITQADIIYLVNYVFKSGAAPQPCVAAGDVNCSGTVRSADIITLVNFVFIRGNPPCDICANSSLAAEC